MPKIFNKDAIEARNLDDGVLRRLLLDDSITSDDNVRLDYWDLDAGSAVNLSVAAGDIAWLQILGGEVGLSGSEGSHTLGYQHLP